MTEEMPDYGEPWSLQFRDLEPADDWDTYTHILAKDRHSILCFDFDCSLEEEIEREHPVLNRIIACVNACRGFDPHEMRRMAVAMKIWEKYGQNDCGALYLDDKYPPIDGAVPFSEFVIDNAKRLNLSELKLLD